MIRAFPRLSRTIPQQARAIIRRMSQLDPPLEDPPTDLGLEPDLIRIPRKYLYTALLPLAFVTGIATGYLFWGRDDSGPQPQDEAAAIPVESLPQAEPVRVDIDLDDDPSIGPKDAPITIVEFSDFNCPYCARFYQETFPALLDAYPDQIYFVYRDFPVVGGFEVAQASECADDQGRYWEFHDLLFTGGLGTNRTALIEYGNTLGMDVEELESCLDEERFASEVEADARYAASLGITATPTFFINGIPLVGARPFDQFSVIIESELREQ